MGSAIEQRELSSCSVTTQRDGGVEGAREAQEEGDICVHLADSCCCAAGTNPTL